MTDPAALPADVVHPIPMRGLACTCGAELEVDDVDRPTALVCPNGCAVALAPVERPAAICPTCAKPIVRAPGQIGRTPAKHPECLTESDRRRLAKLAAANEKIRADKRRQLEHVSA